MKPIFLSLLVCITVYSTKAQFLSKGKIEFERKVNVHKQFDAEGEWGQMLKKSTPQFKTDYFDLYFENDKSMYKPGREADAPVRNFFLSNPASANVVLNDYTSNQFISQKQVFEQNFLIQDTIRKINWKITPDTRKIAGFDCRKAVAIILDSIYVVAFFTDEILVPGGPESFSGLPGMILGLALPRLNTTWFATKVQLEGVKTTDFAPPVKGKKTTMSELKVSIQKSLKDWGKYAARNIWLIMI